MIKSWEELSEALAEFENRISCLEYSLPFRDLEKPLELPKQEEFTVYQWDKLRQLQSEIEYYRRERADLLLKKDKATVNKRSKYD